MQEVKKRRNIEIIAKDFISGNLNSGAHEFGKDLVIDGGQKWGHAEYTFFAEKQGKFRLFSRYASGESRPVEIFLDNKLVKKTGLVDSTGGFTYECLRWQRESEVELEAGRHEFRIFSRGMIPHIEKFIFTQEKDSAFLEKKDRDSYFSMIKRRLSSRGIRPTAKSIISNLKGRFLLDRYLEILGIYDREYAHKGPFHVQIDLTNNCNNACIACWCNSPLLENRKISESEKKQYLPLAMVKELITEISSMGATEVYYSGSGEPFMHPDIMEILEYTKKIGLVCHVNTNFTLLNQDLLDHIIDIGVDFLTVSLWAATADTYIKTHANRTKDDFYKIIENLIYLNERKRTKPHIKLYNVIFNMNYFEIEQMFDLAAKTKSESLEFTLVDTIPKATDVLALNGQERDQLVAQCKKMQLKLDKSDRVKGTGVLAFQFSQFLRRISVTCDVQEAKYDRNSIDKMPCYIGWLFARIIPNGEVHSCLKAHRIPTGTLYGGRFSEIWNSAKQCDFRKKTLVYKKSDPFFKLLGNDPDTQEAGCYKSCDDIGRNGWMHNRIRMLSLPERLMLKSSATVCRTIRKVKKQNNGYLKFDKNPVIAGIQHGRKAFVGPEQVVVDPTNRCNQRCISCWLYSPMLDTDKPSEQWLKNELSKSKLISLVDDLASLGTKRIRFTGGGEPFMNKDLLSVMEHAAKKGLLVSATTNFTLVNNQDIQRLIGLGVDELCVSIWAASADMYRLVHPGTSESYFERLKENLQMLKEVKKDRPRVTFANVIMNNNVSEFGQMYDFGIKYGADALYFTILDIFSHSIKKLQLSEGQREELLDKALQIKSRSIKDSIQLEFFDGFLRRLSKSRKDFEKGEYDKHDIDKIPCYVGWIFSRVLADGSVVPCCKTVTKKMGNINQAPFRDIWNSSVYSEFRARAKYLTKSVDYFKSIGCEKECDNLMHNEDMHKRIKQETCRF